MQNSELTPRYTFMYAECVISKLLHMIFPEYIAHFSYLTTNNQQVPFTVISLQYSINKWESLKYILCNFSEGIGIWKVSQKCNKKGHT